MKHEALFNKIIIFKAGITRHLINGVGELILSYTRPV